jgi:hypothetical protein
MQAWLLKVSGNRIMDKAFYSVGAQIQRKPVSVFARNDKKMARMIFPVDGRREEANPGILNAAKIQRGDFTSPPVI